MEQIQSYYEHEYLKKMQEFHNEELRNIGKNTVVTILDNKQYNLMTYTIISVDYGLFCMVIRIEATKNDTFISFWINDIFVNYYDSTGDYSMDRSEYNLCIKTLNDVYNDCNFNNVYFSEFLEFIAEHTDTVDAWYRIAENITYHN